MSNTSTDGFASILKFKKRPNTRLTMSINLNEIRQKSKQNQLRNTIDFSINSDIDNLSKKIFQNKIYEMNAINENHQLVMNQKNHLQT